MMAYALGSLFGLVFAALFIFLGVKGFSEDGLPLTRSKRVKDLPGNLVGIGCFLVAAWFIWSAWNNFFDRPAPAAPPPAVTMPNLSAAIAPSLPFRNIPGNCLIDAPVILLSAPSTTVNGVPMYLFSGRDQRTGNMFSLGYLDLPEGTMPNPQAAATGSITYVGLTPGEPKNLVFGGRYSTCEVRGTGLVETTPALAVSRCIVVQNRTYLLQVLGPRDSLTDEVAYGFLDSFKLITDPENPQ